MEASADRPNLSVGVVLGLFVVSWVGRSKPFVTDLF